MRLSRPVLAHGERIDVAMVTSDPDIRCLSGRDSVSALTLPVTNRRYSRPRGSPLHGLHPYSGSCSCAKGHRRFDTSHLYVPRFVRTTAYARVGPGTGTAALSARLPIR